MSKPLSLRPLLIPPPPHIYMNNHVYVYIIFAFIIEILMLVIKKYSQYMCMRETLYAMLTNKHEVFHL